MEKERDFRSEAEDHICQPDHNGEGDWLLYDKEWGDELLDEIDRLKAKIVKMTNDCLDCEYRRGRE